MYNNNNITTQITRTRYKNKDKTNIILKFSLFDAQDNLSPKLLKLINIKLDSCHKARAKQRRTIE